MPDAILIDYLSQGGVIVLLSVIVVGAVREWWVPGVTHRRLLAESHAREQELKQLLYAGTKLASEAVTELTK